MRDTEASGPRFILVKSPSVRQQTARRRALVVCGVLALALASGVIGVMSQRAANVVGQPHTGPFSYFPSE